MRSSATWSAESYAGTSIRSSLRLPNRRRIFKSSSHFGHRCVSIVIYVLSSKSPIARAHSVKQPIEADFDIQIRNANVEIIFKPMMSHYSFPLLKSRKVSPRASVRHVTTGDTGDYAPGDVEALAFRLACAAIKSLQQH